MPCEKFESLMYTILHLESLNLEGGGLQLPNIGGGKENSGAESPEKTGAVVWQWVVTFKEAVPSSGSHPSWVG